MSTLSMFTYLPVRTHVLHGLQALFPCSALQVQRVSSASPTL